MKAAGELQGRTQKAGRNKPRGRGDGRGHDGTHTAATAHTTDRSGRDQRGIREGHGRDQKKKI